jgi:hypothetical protein
METQTRHMHTHTHTRAHTRAHTHTHTHTECLKWDDTLWTHADHFRVRRGGSAGV